MKSFNKIALTLFTLASFSLTAAHGAEKADATMMKEAKINKMDAEKTALAKVPNGKVKMAELEKEGGKLVWEINISMPKTKDITEVLVDAKTGEIVSTKVETPEQQAMEAKEGKMKKESKVEKKH